MIDASVHTTDVAIVGAGPVGLFAIFACGMLELRCHVIDALATAGGQCIALYPEKPIYDIPAFPMIEAGDLIERLRQQAAPFEPVYHLNQRVDTLDRQQHGGFRLQTSTGTAIEAGAVIVAAGAGAFGPNRPPLAGIEAFEGTSIFYMVAERAALRGKRIVIAGGGDSAVDWAISLAEIASHVMLVHRRANFRAAPESASRLKRLAEAGRIELVTPCQLHALDGEGGQLRRVIVADLEGKTRALDADVLLPFFGLSMNLGPIADWGLNLDHQHIAIDPATAGTSIADIYAIGDITAYPGKQKLILQGFAEAAVAARAIYVRRHPERALHFEYSTAKGVPGGPRVDPEQQPIHKSAAKVAVSI